MSALRPISQPGIGRITFHTPAGRTQLITRVERAGLDYETIDISTDPDASDFVMSLGYLHTPVVLAGDRHWSGFRPDHIDDLARDAA